MSNNQVLFTYFMICSSIILCATENQSIRHYEFYLTILIMGIAALKLEDCATMIIWSGIHCLIFISMIIFKFYTPINESLLKQFILDVIFSSFLTTISFSFYMIIAIYLSFKLSMEFYFKAMATERASVQML